MTGSDHEPAYFAGDEDEVGYWREKLRTTLYECTASRGLGFAERVWSWMWLPLTIVYVLLGFRAMLRPKPLPPQFSALLLFFTAALLFMSWLLGRAALVLRMRLARAVNNHLLQLDMAIQERIDKSNKARAATDSRHEANRRRRRDAMAYYQSKDWRTQADAARSIADSFNVTEKVAARWVAEWRRDENSASQSGESSNEE